MSIGDRWVLRLGTLTHQLIRRVRTADGHGLTSEVVGEETVTLVVEIDGDKLIRALGYKAAKASKGVSTLQGGAIKVRVVARQKADR